MDPGRQFKFTSSNDRLNPDRRDAHLLEAYHGEKQVGTLSWHHKTGEIKSIQVEKEHRRQGIATDLYFHAKRLAAGDRKIPTPQHSQARTQAGDAWAKTVGGALPPRRGAI